MRGGKQRCEKKREADFTIRSSLTSIAHLARDVKHWAKAHRHGEVHGHHSKVGVTEVMPRVGFVHRRRQFLPLLLWNAAVGEFQALSYFGMDLAPADRDVLLLDGPDLILAALPPVA